MSIIDNIYDGKLYPSEQVVSKNPRYIEADNAVNKLMIECEEKLSKEDYARLDEICDRMADCQDIMAREFFKLGFSMGLLMMKEAIENPYLPKDGENAELSFEKLEIAED